jgi:glycosyltransferase involved in cell wall biosynthesis
MTNPYSFGFAQKSPGTFYGDPSGGGAASMAGQLSNGGLSMSGSAAFAYREPEPARPLRVAHVGQSMVRAGIESWLKGLMRFLDPRRVQVVKCIATAAEEVDPAVIAELRVPVEVGQADCVRRAARECDVLLCWGPRDLGAWLAPARPTLCVLVAHGEGYWTRQIVEGCAAVTDHVIAVSRRVQERVAHDLPATVIPNGVDTVQLARTRPAADVRQTLGFRPDDFVLGYVGRFSDEKRPHLLVEAVARLPAPFKALFVGWGPLGPRLMEYANRLIPGRYAFVKGVNDVGDYYAALDALCVPSAEEGFGLVVVEAMFCERPVIATSVGCVPDLIRDRVNGLVVSGTPESIGEAAQLLRHHPAWARGLAAEGRATAERHCHALAMARAYEDLLLRLWREKTAAARR